MSKLLEQYRTIASQPPGEAQSLPFPVYHHEEIFQYESESLFRREWLFVCCEREIPNSGDYFALEVCGESIVVLRGSDGKLRALSNICRHRGTQLLDDGFGSTGKLIVCPYHAWSYDQQGELKVAAMTKAGEVERDKHCLPHFGLEVHLGLVFINLDPNPGSLSERFEGINEFTGHYQPEQFDTVIPGEIETWQANWKLAMENAMESYHLFKVHRETLETVTPSKLAYYIAGSPEWSLTGGKMLDDSGSLAKWFRGDYPEVYDHYLLISLPPCFVGILTYDSLGWISVLPKDSRKCQIRSGALSRESLGGEDSQSRAFTKAFFAEDKWICERVQQSMYSRLGRGGQLVEMERIVVDFHQYLATRLFDETCGSFHDNSKNTVFA